MKTTIITIVCVLAIIFGAGMFAKSEFKFATYEQLEEARQVIDSIKSQLNIVEYKVDTIVFEVKKTNEKIEKVYNKVDSLQRGQELIYNEVKIITKSKTSFWDLF